MIGKCLSAPAVQPCLSDLRSLWSIYCQLSCLVCSRIALIKAEGEKQGSSLCLAAGAWDWNFMLCWSKQLFSICYRASVGFRFNQQLNIKWKVITFKVPTPCSVLFVLTVQDCSQGCPSGCIFYAEYILRLCIYSLSGLNGAFLAEELFT